MKKVKKQGGFTLAELLIVVAIIAILVAIGIPAFSTAMERSRETVDLSTIRGAYAEFIAGSLGGRADTGYFQVDIKQRDVTSWVVDAGGFLDNVLNDKLPTTDSGIFKPGTTTEYAWTNAGDSGNGTAKLTTGPMWVKFTLVDPQHPEKLAKVPTLSFVTLTKNATDKKTPVAPNHIKTDGTENAAVDYYAEQSVASGGKKTYSGYWYLTKEQWASATAPSPSYATQVSAS